MSAPILRLNPNSLPDAGKVGYSQISVAEAGRLAFVSGQVAWRADGGDVPASLVEQTEIVIENLRHALTEIGSTPEDIVHMRIYVTDLTPQSQEAVMPLILDFLAGALPSLTGIGVAALAAPDLKIEVEMVVQASA
ncbi:RidA family protein [Roseibium sp. MMSF_3544]|uniref:RidA family protein n=1 Tax=unclassified Roseibium TaxID=2629323 RepID=UPI00273E03FD|nr:RidA family protein [Roseibium sp. MMSF_3544]